MSAGWGLSITNASTNSVRTARTVEKFSTAPSARASANGEWRLHPDGSYGEFCWCAPNPELGILEPTLDEEKYFIAAISDKRMVTWNGDGSWVLLWTPRGT